MKIFLIGLPGSGKTTFGKMLAQSLELPFIDLDEAIENHSGQSIAAVFEEHGETHFRQLESERLNDIIDSHQTFVMAAGGGAPCYHNGMALMNLAGYTFFLDTPVDVIVKRLEETKRETRPLLKGNTKQIIETLYKQRLSIYRQAHHHVSTTNPEEMIEIVSRFIESKNPG